MNNFGFRFFENFFWGSFEENELFLNRFSFIVENYGHGEEKETIHTYIDEGTC